MNHTITAPRLSPTWRRRIYRYRRWIAAALVGLAALLLVTSLQPPPPPDPTDARPAPRAGYVAAPVTLTDSALADWLQPGDLVDVIATSGNGDEVARSTTVAQNVLILELPSAGGGSFGSSRTTTLVVLEVSAETGVALATAQAGAALTVVRIP